MLHGVQVVVVVPAFDEAPRIARVLQSMPRAVDRVVVVDDASGDGTADAAKRVDDARVVVLSHSENRGVGASITTGYRHALDLTTSPRDAFVVMAGDGQMDPADLPALVEPIARGDADYVKGCRFDWPGVHEKMPLARLVGGWAFSVITSAAIGQRIRRQPVRLSTAPSRGAATLLDLSALWPRYGYPNDLLGQLAARGLRIREAPVRPIYADEVSRLKLRHLPAITALIARAYLRRAIARGFP